MFTLFELFDNPVLSGFDDSLRGDVSDSQSIESEVTTFSETSNNNVTGKWTPEDPVSPSPETAESSKELSDQMNSSVPYDDAIDFEILPDADSLVFPKDFANSGEFDPKNGCIVVGNVMQDIPFVDQQTHGSCSLMAQEQFVERYIGKDLPESYLEWQAEQWGVYSPEAGTNFRGQDAILDYFDIPHDRQLFADTKDLEKAINQQWDVIIGVDARHFYNDAFIPEGSGHAVSVVGKGVDPGSKETRGFYITDSNYPGSARFITSEQLDRCWWNDMIVIPQQKVT